MPKIAGATFLFISLALSACGATGLGIKAEKVGPDVTVYVDIPGKGRVYPDKEKDRTIEMDVNATAVISALATSPVSGAGIDIFSLAVTEPGTQSLACHDDEGKLVGGTALSQELGGKTVKVVTLKFEPKGSRCEYGNQLVNLPGPLLPGLPFPLNLDLEKLTPTALALFTFKVKATAYSHGPDPTLKTEYIFYIKPTGLADLLHR